MALPYGYAAQAKDSSDTNVLESPRDYTRKKPSSTEKR
jgi:hypothetical protein